MFARVPVPWGPEPKAQIVSGTASSAWVVADQEPAKPVYFDDLFPTDLGIAVLVRNPPVPLALKGLIVAEEDLPPDLKWAVTRGIVKALAPKAAKPQLMALPPDQLSVLDLPPQQWGELPEISREVSPAKIRSQNVLALPKKTQTWTDLPGRRKLQATKVYRDLPDAPRVAAIRPVMPSSLVRSRTDWRQMPPALARWAVEKGISKAEPPRAPKPVISALPSRKQAVLAALRAGEWVRVDELDIFPIRLRQWLEDCGIEFIRCFGWGNAGGQGAATPVNGYVTEDGVIFYVAEDNSTFYVQET
jgi:hypothetical protein